MLENISYYILFGRPLIYYLGILTLSSFLFTASIAVLNMKYGVHKIPFAWHPRMAAVSIILAVIHGTLAILHYL